MKQKNPLSASISSLVAAVIAVLALVRGKWMTPLLAGVFAVWCLWAFVKVGAPAVRERQILWQQKRRAKREEKENEAMSAHAYPEMAQTMLRHVNHRISAQLRASYPEARWEWETDDPVQLTIQGGIGRIRVYGIPGHERTDVELDKSGKLSCSLVKHLSPLGTALPQPTQPPQPPNQQNVDPQTWYERQGRETLEALIADLDSRGHSCLTIKEDGSICVQTMDGEETAVSDTLSEFPERTCWTKLVKVLEQTGLAATASEDGIRVAW